MKQREVTSVQLHNNDGGSSNSSDFRVFGTDETLAKAPHTAAMEHWDNYSYGMAQGWRPPLLCEHVSNCFDLDQRSAAVSCRDTV